MADRCLVLGGSGFLGRHTIAALVSHGFLVRAFDLSFDNVPLQELGDTVDIVEGDFLDKDKMRAALRGCRIVFHHIGTTTPQDSNQDPVFDVQSNVVGTLHLLQQAVSEESVEKIVFTSSGGTVYGIPQQIPTDENHPTWPISSYGITKLAVERYLHLFRHLYGLDYCVLRCGNAYGEYQNTQGIQGIITVFLKRILQNEPLIVFGDGSNRRDYIYAGDVADAHVKAALYQGRERVFNIGCGEGTSINELIATIAKVIGRNPEVECHPARPGDVPINVLDTSRAKDALQWEPKVRLEEGIARTWEWLCQQDQAPGESSALPAAFSMERSRP
jgi:UDP-glucose 4-epimerase